MKIDTTPYYFLNKLVRILLVDSDPRSLKSLNDRLGMIRLFDVQAVPNARRALSLLQQPQRFHVCITELGLSDVKDDEFLILKQYHRHVSCIVLTNSTSPEKGFLANEYGAKALFEKKRELEYARFVKMINQYALLNIINPRHRTGINDPLNHSTDVLFGKSPEFVTQWALEMGVTDRELRYIWTKNLGANTKIILFMYQVFQRAFRYYESSLRRVGEDPLGDGKLVAEEEYRRHEEYFHLHRSLICDYIAFGNVVNFVQQQ
jgi:DNA-binding NarL/FixJ family response regulator